MKIRLLIPSTAESYFVAARSLWNGVEALAPGDGKTLVACALLASQSLECSLKAGLSCAGMTLKELKKQPICHDLEALWVEAAARGIPLEMPTPNWVTSLNSGHADPYFFRYPMGIHGIGAPSQSYLACSLKKVLQMVATSIGQPTGF